MLAALCLAVPGAVEAFTGETLATSIVIAASPALAVPLLLGLHIGQMRVAGRLGDVAFTVNLLGLGLFGGAAYALNVALFPLAVDPAPVTRLALLVSAAVFVVGVILFGVAMLRGREYPRLPVWLYLLGFPPFALAARLPDSPLTSALHILVGVALAWLAVALWGKGSTWQTAQPTPTGVGAGARAA